MNSSLEITVVHLSTSLSGGAGVAASRLHQGLLKQGIHSHLFAISTDENVESNNITVLKRSKKEKFLGKLNAAFNVLISRDSYFSFHSINASDLEEKLSSFNPDNTVIHVHNWFNLTNLKLLRILQKRGFKLVFTLHDVRMMTGGCHVSLSCEKFRTDCGRCPNLSLAINFVPKLILRSEVNFYDLYSGATFICPSRWMLQQAQLSKVMHSSRIVYIPNYLSTDYVPEYKIRKPGKYRVGVASMSENSYFKGDDLVRSLRESAKRESSKFEILKMGDFPQSDLGRNDFWRNIDVLLVPSRADNSPNVIHEAKIQGLRVIATDVGGIKELLDLDYDLLIPLEDLNFNNLKATIEQASRTLTSHSEVLEIRRKYIEFVDLPLEKVISTYFSLVEL